MNITELLPKPLMGLMMNKIVGYLKSRQNPYLIISLNDKKTDIEILPENYTIVDTQHLANLEQIKIAYFNNLQKSIENGK